MSNGAVQNAANANSAPARTPGSLLGPGDQLPYEVVNPGGSAPVVFICDHASNAIPARLESLGLRPEALEDHVAWDIGAADVARQLSRAFDAPLVLAGFSRLVVDCNRNPTHLTSIMSRSDGFDIPGNHNLTENDRRARVAEIFQPYHDAVDRVLVRKCEGDQVPAVVSVHSYTPTLHDHPSEDRPWDVGILWDKDPRIARPLIETLAGEADLNIGENQPYTGHDEMGHSIRRHAERRGLPHVLAEIRQNLIDNETGAAAWARRMEEALRRVFASDPDLFRVEYY